MNASIDHTDIALRLIVAVLAGVVIGLDREFRGKPVGIRTLALVSLGSALICVTTIQYAGLQGLPDATSRVVQGVIQGVLTGVGFLGAAVVWRREEGGPLKGLTTAATVWVCAAIGIACGLAAWSVVGVGVGLVLVVLIALEPLDSLVDKLRAKHKAGKSPVADD